MQFNSLFAITVVTGLVSALPHASTTTPIPRAPTDDQPTRNWPKVVSDPSASHAPTPPQHSQDNGDQCPQLCSLVAQACVVAVPNDEAFCWDTYKACSDRCGGQ